MARQLDLLSLVLVIFIFGLPIILAGTPTTCDYSTGHGFLLFAVDDACTSFATSHLGEFECPHQYDVKALVKPSGAAATAYCKALQSGSQTVFTIAPEFVLPSFMAGNISSYQSDLMSGFFNATLVSNTTFDVVTPILYAVQYDVIPSHSLKYFLFSDGNDNFFASHAISTPPDFDHVVLISIISDDFAWPTGRTWPLLIEFEYDNRVENALQQGQQYTGEVFLNDGAHGMKSIEVRLFVKRNVYPGPYKENGNGMLDFMQYCVDTSRPKWSLCY